MNRTNKLFIWLPVVLAAGAMLHFQSIGKDTKASHSGQSETPVVQLVSDVPGSPSAGDQVPIISPTASDPVQVSGRPERELKIEKVLSLGSDAEHEDFHNPKSFAVDKKGRIFILDSGNSRVLRFSADGKFEMSFGKPGQGPGELSKEAMRIRILEDGRLYIIDNAQRRISVFDENGRFVISYNTVGSYDDITLKDGTYYLSNLLLREGYRPIHTTKDPAKIKDSIGHIIEPTPGIIGRIATAPDANILEIEFTFQKATSVFVGRTGRIIYSQLWPYHLLAFHPDGSKAGEHVGEMDFDTHFPLELSLKGGVTMKRVKGPAATVYAPIPLADGRIVVPIMDPKRTTLYLDVIDADLHPVQRYRIANCFFDPARPAGITDIHIDDKNNLYCLVLRYEDIPMFYKYGIGDITSASNSY